MSCIDLDSLPAYTKQQVAEHQLDRAIQLLLDENDPICAITLAGAAEELLGKLVEQGGGTHSLKGFIDQCVALGRLAHGEEWSPKTFAEIANYFRNELKHFAEGEVISIPREAAYEMIDRAAENLWLLAGRETEQVRRYMSKADGQYLASWLRTISLIRNISAHHSRLWNRPIANKPQLPSPERLRLLAHVGADDNAKSRVYGGLALCRYLLRTIEPGSAWHLDLASLCRSFPNGTHLNLSHAGFPTQWTSEPLWD